MKFQILSLRPTGKRKRVGEDEKQSRGWIVALGWNVQLIEGWIIIEFNFEAWYHWSYDKI